MNAKENTKKRAKILPKLTIDPIVLTDSELKTVAGGGIDGEEGNCFEVAWTAYCPCWF